MTLPTASELNRALVCRASTVLPRIESTSPYAARGQVIHRFLEDVNRLGREAALERVPDVHRPLCEVLDLEALNLDPARLASEVAFALNPKAFTARELGRNIGRGYGAAGVGPDEFAGTIDLVGLLGEDEVLLGDFKSGWRHEALTPPAKENAQLLFAAAAACMAWGRKRARLVIIRIFDDGGVWTDSATVTAAELDAFVLQLADLADRIAADRAALAQLGTPPPATSGPGCTYCKSFNVCPGKVTLVNALANPAATQEELVGMIEPAGAARAWALLKAYDQVSETVRSLLKQYVHQNGPIDLGNGYQLGPVPWPYTKIDGAKARPILRATYGEPAADVACEVEVTKASITRMARELKRAKPFLKIGELEKAALKVLVEAHAVESGHTTQVREHRAEKSAKKPTPQLEEESTTHVH